MKTILFKTPGKPAAVLEVTERPRPEPGPGEVRIRVLASPVNPSDVMFIQNLYGIRPQLPSGAGFEGVGVVDALGEGVELAVGTRVSFTGLGAWSEYMVTPQRSLIPVPDAMPDEVAAQLFVNPFTAFALVNESGVAEGGWLMITAGASAFGKMVIQLCAHRGIRTIATVRRDELNEDLLKLGLNEVINTETEDLAARVGAITQGAGVDCVLDSVGGRTASEALKCLRKGGTMLVFGLLSLQDPQLNVGMMIFRELTVRGFWLSDWMRRVDNRTRQAVAQEVVSMLASGAISVPVEATYPLDRIAEAVIRAEEPGRWGKILVKP